MTDQRPTLREVLRARQVIARFLSPTPLLRHGGLEAALGCECYVKHENYQPLGAFKLRGGLYLLSCLSEAERRCGVIAPSTGNHGQSIAYAARQFGVRAIIGVPEGANPDKVASMRRLGAEVIFHGPDYDSARTHVEEVAHREGLRYIHASNEPLLLAGVGTIALEMLEQQPDLDTIIVPVGGGSCVAATALVAKTIDPAIRVIGVQAEGAPAAWRSWRERAPLSTERIDTFAEGLATRTTFDYPRAIMWELLDDFLLVSDAELRAAIRLYLEGAHTLAEGAGAASLAGALQLREQLAGRRVGLILTGGNLTLDQLRRTLNEG